MLVKLPPLLPPLTVKLVPILSQQCVVEQAVVAVNVSNQTTAKIVVPALRTWRSMRWSSSITHSRYDYKEQRDAGERGAASKLAAWAGRTPLGISRAENSAHLNQFKISKRRCDSCPRNRITPANPHEYSLLADEL